jgi:hypothetical protein
MTYSRGQRVRLVLAIVVRIRDSLRVPLIFLEGQGRQASGSAREVQTMTSTCPSLGGEGKDD